MNKLFILAFMLIGFASYGQVTLKCPPCRPAIGCGQCWETQAEADACNQRQAGQATQLLEVDEKLNIFPNPSTTGSFYIENQAGKKGRVMVMNQAGVLISRFRLEGEKKFKVTGTGQHKLATGLYHVIFTSDEGEVERFKVIMR